MHPHIKGPLVHLKDVGSSRARLCVRRATTAVFGLVSFVVCQILYVEVVSTYI